MNKNDNFLVPAENDMLIVELDDRLEFTAVIADPAPIQSAGNGCNNTGCPGAGTQCTNGTCLV